MLQWLSSLLQDFTFEQVTSNAFSSSLTDNDYVLFQISPHSSIFCTKYPQQSREAVPFLVWPWVYLFANVQKAKVLLSIWKSCESWSLSFKTCHLTTSKGKIINTVTTSHCLPDLFRRNAALLQSPFKDAGGALQKLTKVTVWRIKEREKFRPRLFSCLHPHTQAIV